MFIDTKVFHYKRLKRSNYFGKPLVLIIDKKGKSCVRMFSPFKDSIGEPICDGHILKVIRTLDGKGFNGEVYYLTRYDCWKIRDRHSKRTYFLKSIIKKDYVRCFVSGNVCL